MEKTKNMPVNHDVLFTKIFDVWAPNTDCVKPLPNAEPRPSCFPRCIKIMSTKKTQTITWNVSNTPIKMLNHMSAYSEHIISERKRF